jgi:hypothetical protein
MADEFCDVGWQLATKQGAMTSTTHIAGPIITAFGRIIQRCSLCGEKLCDSRDHAAPLNPDGTAPEFPTWQSGRLVRVDHGNPAHWIMLDDTDKLPEDSCFGLME